MTLFDHKGKQIVRDAMQNCFLQDFRTMVVSQIRFFLLFDRTLLVKKKIAPLSDCVS
jgi:hypothetical protein